MAAHEPVQTTNLDGYGNKPLPWSRAWNRVEADLPKMETAGFLATAGPDGRPHSTGIGALKVGDDIYFTSGPRTRKSRNLASNPACTLSLRLEGMDLVLEGEATRVTDGATVQRVARAYSESGWPAEAEGDALTAPFSAPSAGPPPWYLYRLAFDVAFGVATAEPHGATRWRFER
ncbi:pyridoxamine 5'-phosphate oxidase family protein [Actinomadura graeca]|uniref:Pyridoxamine 5'-phosphate oxidase family protein n=1 Tax=Actinomadura graeca TaxID=2750812 RepID=A0ABX8R5Y5_9ACTN|nr:pyridoxamine 5'-phosphate oxidase family protein [Actinomadura graeca]QXJ25659.1 pyridoxamine 5'-phosphate oxidase family protein [Actinomadura graeca]